MRAQPSLSKPSGIACRLFPIMMMQLDAGNLRVMSMQGVDSDQQPSVDRILSTHSAVKNV
jgi:hypothetical protein